MKTRYKILIINIVLTLLYCLGFQIFLPLETEELDFLSAIITTAYLAFLFLIHYNWIHLIWLGLIVLGIIKKKREFIYGGLFSMILSILIFVIAISYLSVT